MLLKTHSLVWYLQYVVLIAFKEWSAVFLVGLILLEDQSQVVLVLYLQPWVVIIHRGQAAVKVKGPHWM